MKIALIANPASGGRRRYPRIMAAVQQRLASAHIDVDVYPTEYHGHIRSIVNGLSLNRYDAVVMMGGDGTNYHALNQLISHFGSPLPTLGIIPLGRGNSFARDLGVVSIDTALEAICRGNTRPVDVCSYLQGETIYYFVNLMGFGFVTDVARTAAHFGWVGDISYVIGVFYQLVGLKAHAMMLDIDGRRFTENNCFVEFCNSRYTGGAMLMAPDARIDDGYFDAVILKASSRFFLLRAFPKIFSGAHVHLPAVSVIRGQRASVVTRPSKTLLPDGEIFGTTPTTVKVLPRLVRYFSLT